MFTPSRRAYEQNTLNRFNDLRPNKKRKKPKPPWETSSNRCLEMDDMTKELEYPSQWPVVSVMFEFGGGMSTTEALLKLGPVGAYQFSFSDAEPEFVADIVTLFHLLGKVMNKRSKPADRKEVELEGARAFTRLEMMMPSAWSTFVRHTCSSHCIDTLESCGPFWTCNMLDHERMHTLLKSLARGKKDLMASLVNNYRLLDLTMLARLSDDGPELALEPRRSTPAGFETRPDSSRRGLGQLDISPLGEPTRTRLSNDDFNLVQELWRIAEPEYEALWTMFEVYNRRRSAATSCKNIADFGDVPNTQRFHISDRQRLMMTMSNRVMVRTLRLNFRTFL